MRIILAVAFALLFSTKSNSQCLADFSFTINADTVNFISQASTSQGVIISHHWDFGDGSTGTQANPVHIYPFAGLYTVKYSVQSSLGCTDMFTMFIAISPSFYYTSLCPPAASASLYSSQTGNIYQWQVCTDSVNYTNLTAGPYYSGITTNELALVNIPSSFTGYRYRCVTDGNPGIHYRVSFNNSWSGTQDNNWSNPANWSCGTMPDANTDVVVTTGSVIVNVNSTIRSLFVQAPATVTVQPGVVLTILH